MSWFSFGLFSGKLKLNKNYFSRNKWREESDIFGDVFFTLQILSNVLVAMFFSPVVTTPTISMQDLLVMITNVVLALKYLYEFVFRLYKTRLVSRIERNLTIAGLILSIIIAVNLFPAVFSVALTQVTFLMSFSTLATAINSFFCIKNIVIPPLKCLLENIFRYWGSDISEEYPPEILLDEKKDDDVIRILLKLEFDKTLDAQHQKGLARIRKMQVKLNGYKNKYNEQMLGGIFRRQDIQKIEDAMTDITINGKCSAANDFFFTKIQRKSAKIHRLKAAIKELDQVVEHGDNWIECNAKASEYFENYVSVNAASGMKTFWTEGRPILEAEVERQRTKWAKLEECLPPELKLSKCP